MGRSIKDLLNSAPRGTSVLRSIDPHKFSLSGDEDVEQRRNRRTTGDKE